MSAKVGACMSSTQISAYSTAVLRVGVQAARRARLVWGLARISRCGDHYELRHESTKADVRHAVHLICTAILRARAAENLAAFLFIGAMRWVLAPEPPRVGLLSALDSSDGSGRPAYRDASRPACGRLTSREMIVGVHSGSASLSFFSAAAIDIAL